MRAMKDSGIAWIGEIPEGWGQGRFRYSGTYTKGKLPSSTNTEGLGSPIIGASEMNGKTPHIFTNEDLPLCEQEDILILWDGANAGLIATGLNGIVSSTVVRYRPNDEGLLNRFVYFQLKAFEGYFREKVNGTTIPHMNNQFIDELCTLVPPLAEQRGIAAFLDTKCAEVDELLNVQEQFIEELKNYKQALITETVTKGLTPNTKTKQSGIEWIGEIPEEWRVERLKNKVHRRNEKADNTSLQYIGLEHLVGFSEEMVETENTYDSEGANLCLSGDVIFGKLRPYLGKAKVITSPACCSSEFLVLKDIPVPKYMRYVMLSDWFIEIINASTYGTKMPRANADFIMEMLIPVPPLAEQEEIAAYLDQKCAEIDQLIAIKQQKAEELREYRKSLIYEYVTGKKQL